jgi:hypothetical protein
MNVTLGNDSAIEGYKNPFERDLYTHDMLVKKAGEIGVSLKVVPKDGDAGEDAPDDLLAARIQDFVHHRPAPGHRVTHVGAPLGSRIDLVFREIVAPGGIWDNHAAKGSKAVWVESDDPALAKMLADYFGCPIGRPADWVETRE